MTLPTLQHILNALACHDFLAKGWKNDITSSFRLHDDSWTANGAEGVVDEVLVVDFEVEVAEISPALVLIESENAFHDAGNDGRVAFVSREGDIYLPGTQSGCVHRWQSCIPPRRCRHGPVRL